MNVFSFRILNLSLVAAIAILCDVGGSPALAQSARADSLEASQEGSVMLAQSERKKRSRSPKERRKKKAPAKEAAEGSETSSAAESPGGSEAVAIVHAAHEGNKDEPYSWHVALSSSLSRLEQQPEGGDKVGSGYYNFDLQLLKVIASSLEVGPIISWSDSTTKVPEGDPSKSQSLGLGLRVSYNIGNVDKDVFLPFVWLGFGIANEKAESGNITSTSSGTGFGFGVGGHYFVDSNVALTGELSWRTENVTTKAKAGEGPEVESKSKRTSLDFLNLGFSLFI
jgi:hypothetical protein